MDVRIVFDIPQELQAFNRVFTIYRVHQTQDGGGRYHEALLNDLDSWVKAEPMEGEIFPITLQMRDSYLDKEV